MAAEATEHDPYHRKDVAGATGKPSAARRAAALLDFDHPIMRTGASSMVDWIKFEISSPHRSCGSIIPLGSCCDGEAETRTSIFLLNSHPVVR